jgi:hypothetical protein
MHTGGLHSPRLLYLNYFQVSRKGKKLPGSWERDLRLRGAHRIVDMARQASDAKWRANGEWHGTLM